MNLLYLGFTIHTCMGAIQISWLLSLVEQSKSGKLASYHSHSLNTLHHNTLVVDIGEVVLSIVAEIPKISEISAVYRYLRF